MEDRGHSPLRSPRRDQKTKSGAHVCTRTHTVEREQIRQDGVFKLSDLCFANNVTGEHIYSTAHAYL